MQCMKTLTNFTVEDSNIVFYLGESSICLNKESIKTMLGVIEYLRQQTRAQQGWVSSE